MENRGFELQEKYIKQELGDLENNYASMKKEVRLLERMEGVDGLQSLNFEENLVRIKRKCDGFGEMLERLREDYNLLSKREDRNQQRHKELIEEHLKMVERKNGEICELEKKLNEIRGRCEAFEQRMKERDMIIEAFEKKIECHDGIIEKMRLQELQSRWTIKILRRGNLKAVQAIEDLRCQNLEGDKAVAAKENALTSRLKTLEEEESSLLNVKVYKSLSSPGEKQICGLKCCSTHNTDNAGVRNVAPTPTSRRLELIDIIKCKDFPKEGGRDVIQTKSNEGGTGTPVECTPQAGEESRCHSSQSNGGVADPVWGRSIRLRDSVISKNACVLVQSAASVDINTIIEIIDVDDLPNLGRDLCSKDSSVSISAKRKRSSEESCFDSLASIKNQCLRSSWMSATDMRKAFIEDDNLCMNAVCVLFRELIRSSDDALISPFDDKGEVEFPHFTALSGPEVAEYLINGDPYTRLKKFASEVKQEHLRPDIIEISRRLALDYNDRVFSIYCSKRGSFFKSSKAS